LISFNLPPDLALPLAYAVLLPNKALNGLEVEFLGNYILEMSEEVPLSDLG